MDTKRYSRFDMMKLIAVAFLACALGASAIDNNTAMPANMDSPASNAIAVTPSDSTDLQYVTRGLYVGVSGNLAVNMAGGQTSVVYPNVPVGLWPYRVTRILNTGTTASGIVAVW